MIHHTSNGQEYLMLPVKEGARDFILKKSYWGIEELHYKYGDVRTSQGIGEGDYQILFLASQATEGQAGEVVEKCPDLDFWCDYMSVPQMWTKLTALESLSSLLSSHGMEGETLFIKRVK